MSFKLSVLALQGPYRKTGELVTKVGLTIHLLGRLHMYVGKTAHTHTPSVQGG